MDKEKYKEESKKRLETIIKKKIDTTMIGSLSAFEENIMKSSFFNKLDDKLKFELENLYDKTRTKILDIGNSAKRSVAEEFEQHEIEWKRYQITMKVKPRTEQ